MLGRGDGSQVAAVSVPVAVFAGLRGHEPPGWLTAAAAATYLAWDLLDDQMDGDPAPFWRERSPADRTIGAHSVDRHRRRAAGPVRGPRDGTELTRVYLEMVATVTAGQLRAETPLGTGTTPASVAAGNDARSGDMLAALAANGGRGAGADTPDPGCPRALRPRAGAGPPAGQRPDRARVRRHLRPAEPDGDDGRRLRLQRTAEVDGSPCWTGCTPPRPMRTCGAHGRRRTRTGRADTRTLARLHLAEATRLANSTIHNPFGRMIMTL